MPLLKYLKSIVLFQPWPLNKEWEELSIEKFNVDKGAPVNFTDINFLPDRRHASRLISAKYVNHLILELMECLTYFASEEAIDKGAYIYIDSNYEFVRKDFDITIKLTPENKDKRSKPRLQISFSHHQMNEGYQLAITRSIKKIIYKYSKSKELGMEFAFSVIPAHKKWKAPENFASLQF